MSQFEAALDNGRPTRQSHGESPEPLAIIGIGCRFPGGANDPASFWSLLVNGVDAISEIPPDRWDLASFYNPDSTNPGTTYTRRGGFLAQIDQFDAAFFGISPREAASMDPQQRLLLEVAWEAIEDSRRAADELAGTRTGVFVGISTHDYSDLHVKDIFQGDGYTNSGGALSIAANRLSYVFDLRGPSMAIDTACSSSLVAVHLACRSLWSGECDMAITGGVNCILTPETTVGFSHANMLSADGSCKTFDASANGYVRGEGAGLIVLKPLARAVADGDPVYAVIRATGVNQDGHTNGLTVPSQDAQAALLRDVYAQAEIAPDQILAIEAHGTGTPVGDPIEANAIGSVLGVGRPPDSFLRVGSVKTNIGHLEAASGIAGLIKAALEITHSTLIPNLHFTQPNPRIPFDALGLRVQQQVEPFPDHRASSVIGINSFGFGGTNAHVALDRVPPAFERRRRVSADVPAYGSYLLPLSCRGADALPALAKTWADFVDDQEIHDELSVAALCHAASTERAHHDYRLALTVTSLDDVSEGLEAVIAGEPRSGTSIGRQASTRRPPIAFVFSGMGPQWAGMARQLFEEEPVFRSAIEACDAWFQPLAGWSLLEVFMGDSDTLRMSDTAVAQPANFALQVGLAAVWQSWGITPDVIVGHSAGEVAAAYAAGILTLADAVTVTFHRSRLQQRTTGQGRILAVGLSVADAAAEVAGSDGFVSLAAVNSPRASSLAGEAAALERIAASLEARGLFARFIEGSVPYHSPYMDPLKLELLASLAGIEPRTARVPFYSAVTGQLADGPELDASYWWQNVRQPVRFADALDRLFEEGTKTCLEMSAHPVLARAIAEVQMARGTKGAVLPSLRRAADDRATLLGSLGTLYTLGSRIEWQVVNPGSRAQTRLPGYPWQRERCWDESEVSASFRLGKHLHPLLERRVESAKPLWETSLKPQRVAYLADHRVQGSVVYPASAYVEMALAAARDLNGDGPCGVDDIEFRRPLILQAGEPAVLQFALEPQDNSFSIYSRGKSASWTVHAIGKLSREKIVGAVAALRPEPIQARSAREQSGDECQAALEAIGLHYGPQFRGIERLWIGPGESLGHIVFPADVSAGIDRYRLHPAILDACFQVLSGAASMRSENGSLPGTYFPVKLGRLRFFKAAVGPTLWAHARLTKDIGTAIEGDFTIADEHGDLIAEITGFRCQAIQDPRTAVKDDLTDCLFDLEWLPRASASDAGDRPADGLSTPAEIAAAVARRVDGTAAQRVDATAAGRVSQPVDEAVARIETLCGLFALETLRQLGWTPREGETFTSAALAERLGVPDSSIGGLVPLLTLLHEDGLLSADGAEWRVSRTPAPYDLRRATHALAEQHTAYEDVLALLERSAASLPARLRAEAGASPELAVDEWIDEALVFDDSPYGAADGHLLARAIAAAVARLPEDRTIRVLEIGARSGGMTAAIVPALPAGRTEYVFSDATDALFPQARRRFGHIASIDYQTLNIGSDPIAQGSLRHSFDIVIAPDGLRAAGDLAAGLAHVRTLAAADGLVMVLGRSRPSRARDLIDLRLDAAWRLAPGTTSPAPHVAASSSVERLLADSGFIAPTPLVHPNVIDSNAGGPDTTLWVARAPHVDTGGHTERTQDTSAAGAWMVFTDRAGVGADLAESLRQRGGTTLSVAYGPDYLRTDAGHFTVRPESPEDLQKVLDAATAMQLPLRGVVHLWSQDAPAGDTAGFGALDAVTARGAVNVLHLVHALTRFNAQTPPRLWLVTRGVHDVAGRRPGGVLQSSLWGLGRVIMNEHQHLRCTLVDLDPQGAAADQPQRLLREILADEVEQEVCLRPNARFIARLVRSTRKPRQAAAPAAGASTPFHLDVTRPGSLENLIHREYQRRAPGPGEVEIEVHAAGLNFRDVMKTMGLYPSEDGDPFWLGDECSGTVAAVGTAVEGLAVGDAVVAIAPACFSSYVTCPAEFVVRKPAHLSFEQAAAIGTVFLTTHYALNHLAHISRSDRVLIHAAAGGVGLAAIQLAKAAGAEIFATAGSPHKRDFVASLGVKHIMDSRSLSFADETMRITKGKGVSVVLNSLAGEFIPKSLALLEPMGRFLEIGKVDLYQNSKVGLYPFRSGLSFHTIDMGWVLQHRRDLARTLLVELMAMFENRTLEPLPVRTFSVADAVKAFRFMAQAKHIGKIVLTLRDGQPIDVVPARGAQPKALFQDAATYLMTGGLSGFGLAIAQWMVEQGARHLVLVGRRGIASPDVQQAVDEMRRAGAAIEVAKVDVSREDEVTALVARIGRTMPPLRGVFHAANVMDDGYLLQLNPERFERVMAPKANGAWNLHCATLGQPLDYFVLFSSVASWVGNVGQGNYAAANAFLDGLAQYRRSRQLPALAINWGAIAEVGYIARNPDVGRLLDRQGVLGLKPREATTLLAQLLTLDCAEAGAMRLDLGSMAGSQSHGAAYRRFSHLLLQRPTGAAADEGQGGKRGELLERLRSLPPEEQQQRLEAILRREVAGVLGIPASRLDPQQPLRQIGFDSLMSVELEAALENELGIDLPMGFLLGDEVSVAVVSQRLVEQIRTLSGGDTSTAGQPAPQQQVAGGSAHADARASLVASQA